MSEIVGREGDREGKTEREWKGEPEAGREEAGEEAEDRRPGQGRCGPADSQTHTRCRDPPAQPSALGPPRTCRW